MTRHKQTEHGHPRRGEKGGSRVAHKTKVTTKDQGKDTPWAWMHRGTVSSYTASAFDTPGASSSAFSSGTLSTPLHAMSPTPALPSHDNAYHRNHPAIPSNEAHPAGNTSPTRFIAGADSAPGLLSSKISSQGMPLLDTVSDLSLLAISSPAFANPQRASAQTVPHLAGFPAPDELYFLDLDAEEWVFLEWLKAAA